MDVLHREASTDFDGDTASLFDGDLSEPSTGLPAGEAGLDQRADRDVRDAVDDRGVVPVLALVHSFQSERPR